MKTNVLVVHGGGPTAVMNASLYGVIKEAKRHPEIGAVYGALGGMEGILEERLVNLSELTKAEAKLLLTTPGSAIGSSRYPITKEVYRKMAEVIKKYNICCLLPNGKTSSHNTGFHHWVTDSIC